jgi:hypothetical protein
MITDLPPSDPTERQEYLRSEAMLAIKLPPAEPLRSVAKDLEAAMTSEDRKKIQSICNVIAKHVSESFDVQSPKVRVLGLRPLEEGDRQVDELFGDYDLEIKLIRLWMRTAVLGKMTSYGTFLSTLCHELCHHLDVVHFDFENTFHTRGFYERAGLLYSHARGVPNRVLVWTRQKNGVLRINWPATMKGSKK